MSEQTQVKARVVAIVGRPNVGKSAIFNRIAGRRIAIVHEQSGVTRDRLMREVSWSGERFQLVDTGGISVMDDAQSKDTIEGAVRQQADAALSDAAVALLVVDVEAGVVPMDLEVARLLHTSGCRTFVLVNKCDTAPRDEGRFEFEKLGFPVFAVAALHDRGFGPVMEAVNKALPPFVNTTIADPLKVAIVGRPNVGKSSYVNRLLRSDRVIVSAQPGTTRDSIDIPFQVGSGDQARHYLLIDTAGMRPMSKVNSAVERFSHFRAEESIENADVVVLLLDAAQGPSSQDKRIAALILEKKKGCVILVNKWDLADEVSQREYGPALLEALPFMSHCPIEFTSASTGYNIRRTIDVIDHVAAQVRVQLPTGVLNRTVINACEKTQSPTVKGKRLKIFYMTQVSTQPITLLAFVNHAQLVKEPYKAFILRTIREKFGLEGAPIDLQFKARERKSISELTSGKPSDSRPRKARTTDKFRRR